MRGLLLPVLVLGMALAGCSGSAGGGSKDPADADFDDYDVDATESTGVILGLVVDDRIVPVPEAEVRLALPGAEAIVETTDGQGRFVFQDLEPATYFLQVQHPMHRATQTSVDVLAGVDEPPLTRVQLERLFAEDPYSDEIVQEGFFECSQAGTGLWLYASSNCVVDPYRRFLPPPSPTSFMDNLTAQEREWHTDVGAGWQSMIVEMTWEPSAQSTSENMGIVLSTYKPTRDGAHWFAEGASGNPLWMRLDTGVVHPTASGVDPSMIPPEGMQNMSFFASVRPGDPGCTLGCVPPGIAVNQDFKVFLHIFYFGQVEEEWSFVDGDEPPF